MSTYELKSQLGLVAHALGEGQYADIERRSTNPHQKDVRTLGRMGKKQVLKRRFGFLSLFGFSCTILITWETVLALFSLAFVNGGPAGSVYGFIIAWACTLSVYMVIAELASIAPIAGGQYFWVAILAPKGKERFYSYMTGWITSIAWMATLATASLFVAGMIRGIIALNFDDFTPKPWQGTVICWIVIAVSVFINTVVSSWLPKFEGFILIFHILGFFACMIPLLYMSPKGSVESVFLTSLNEGGWPTQGLSYCVGFVGSVATFVGADAAVHMSEEIENAALNVPRAIFTTMILNGAMGFGMMLSVLFCLGDLESVLNSKTGFPFIQVFYNATQSHAGTSIMTGLTISLGWAAVVGFTATSSRMVWSLARDRGLPFHKYLSKVEPRTHIPVVSVAVTSLIPCLLALIYVGSPTVFSDVVSMSVSGFYISYFIPSSLLLYHRIKGQILEFSSAHPSDPNFFFAPSSDGDDKVVKMKLVWGPWRVPGMLGIINNAFACVYLVVVVFWSFWPPEANVTPQNMNYSILVTGSVILFSVIYYLVYGRRQYVGPLVEEEVVRQGSR